MTLAAFRQDVRAIGAAQTTWRPARLRLCRAELQCLMSCYSANVSLVAIPGAWRRIWPEAVCLSRRQGTGQFERQGQ